jgi:hypothetical protein
MRQNKPFGIDETRSGYPLQLLASFVVCGVFTTIPHARKEIFILSLKEKIELIYNKKSNLSPTLKGGLFLEINLNFQISRNQKS